jgi:hypothetical protein
MACAMNSQLVLQFDATSLAAFDLFVALEEKIADEFGATAINDGHDFGALEFNIFILVDVPIVAFEKALRSVRSPGPELQQRAAYRELAGETYEILWPSTLTEFTVA